MHSAKVVLETGSARKLLKKKTPSTVAVQGGMLFMLSPVSVKKYAVLHLGEEPSAVALGEWCNLLWQLALGGGAWGGGGGC